MPSYSEFIRKGPGAGRVLADGPVLGRVGGRVRAVLSARRGQAVGKFCGRALCSVVAVVSARRARKVGIFTTVLACYRVPGEGAVIACDSRVTMSTGVVSDTCDKWLVCGSVVLAVYGMDGGLPQALKPAKNWAEVMKRGTEYSKGTPLDWGVLAYDRRVDRVMLGEHLGGQYQVSNVYCTGAGGDYAQGWLDSQPRAKSLNAAAKLCRTALKAVFRRDVSCGGRIRILIARGKRGPVELH